MWGLIRTFACSSHLYRLISGVIPPAGFPPDLLPRGPPKSPFTYRTPCCLTYRVFFRIKLINCKYAWMVLQSANLIASKQWRYVSEQAKGMENPIIIITSHGFSQMLCNHGEKFWLNLLVGGARSRPNLRNLFGRRVNLQTKIIENSLHSSKSKRYSR